MSLIDASGSLINKSDTDGDRVVNSFYCGQIQALHHLVHFLWKSKRKYKKEDVFRFIESRYCYLVREYPNFYNQIAKNDKELKSSGEAEATYHSLFVEMMKNFRDISKNDPEV